MCLYVLMRMTTYAPHCARCALSIQLEMAVAAVLLHLRSVPIDESARLYCRAEKYFLPSCTDIYTAATFQGKEKGGWGRGSNNIDDEFRRKIEKPSRVYVTLDSRSSLWDNVECIDKKNVKRKKMKEKNERC